MVIDFTPLLVLFVVAPLTPVIVGVILRATGHRRAARVAALAALVVVVAIEALLDGPGTALPLTGVPLLLAIALYFTSRDRPDDPPR